MERKSWKACNSALGRVLWPNRSLGGAIKGAGGPYEGGFGIWGSRAKTEDIALRQDRAKEETAMFGEPAAEAG